MPIIGRELEVQILEDCCNSNRPEFVAVYGRRRVGKTYLIRELFQERITFFLTGINEGSVINSKLILSNSQ